MNAKEIDKRLMYYINPNIFTLNNVFVLGSAFESDRLTVSDKMHWVEYEIKRSVKDFHADNFKISSKRAKNPLNKHEYYANPGNRIIKRFGKGKFPKPRRFFYVLPEDLVMQVIIPKHCGLITVGNSLYSAKLVKKAPILKDHTKITQKQFYNLAKKAGRK